MHSYEEQGGVEAPFQVRNCGTAVFMPGQLLLKPMDYNCNAFAFSLARDIPPDEADGEDI